MPSAYAPSPNVAQLRESATLLVSARAKALRAAGRRIIDLGAGEPDFDTPEFIRRAAQRAIDAGATRYTATEGILPLRQAIASRAAEACKHRHTIDAAEVVVSTGSKQALFNACFILFGDGDEVLIPTPAWTSYYEMVSLARATPVAVTGDPASGFKVTAPMLERAATPRTKGLMLNSPCNPTGAVYSRDELRALLALADDRGWWVISDEIYTRIAYDDHRVSGGGVTTALEVAERRDRLIVVDGVAKSYAMTGWRIGWAIAPRTVAAAMTALQSHTTSNAAAVSQHAALAALSDVTAANQAIATMVDRFASRRAGALAQLRKMPALRVIPPDGAFYLYIDVSSAMPGEEDPGAMFAQRLLERHDVAVVPGSAFHTPDWVRVSYAAPDSDVTEGIARLIEAAGERV